VAEDELSGWLHAEMFHLPIDAAHPTTNWEQHRITSENSSAQVSPKAWTAEVFLSKDSIKVIVVV